MDWLSSNLAISIITSGSVSAVVLGIAQIVANRNKVNAEANDLNATAEAKTYEKWKDLALEMEKRNVRLQEEMEKSLKLKNERIQLLEEENSLERQNNERLRAENERLRKLLPNEGL